MGRFFAVTDMLTSFLSNNPELVAVAIAVVGFLVAKFMARLADKFSLFLQRSTQRADSLKAQTPFLYRFQPVFRGAVYYSTLLFFLLLAIRVLGVVALEDWLAVLLGYFPQLFLVGIIIIAGYLAGVIVAGLVASVMGEDSHHLLPKIAQTSVVTVAVLTGLGQVDIDISFITNVLVILLAAFIGGLSLAFALGSRQLVANLLARRELERYSIGSRIRVNGVEGTITELLGTAVVLESEAGTITIPTSRFSETDVVLLNDVVSTKVADSGD
jgi:hypothetical protein